MRLCQTRPAAGAETGFGEQFRCIYSAVLASVAVGDYELLLEGVAMANLIGSVKVTPTQLAPGQSVLVQVLDSTGAPYAADSSVTIALDGIPVPSRYYQFPTAGKRSP
jgi:hypothetical protein